jgi:DNA-binding GntR family transcriptional regulator
MGPSVEPDAPIRSDHRSIAAPRPLGRRVQDELERLILSGVLAPGQRLNEVALARQLGTSRGPVREAVRALEKYGLVTVIMNRGAFVRVISLDEAIDTYEVGMVLFGFASGQLAASITVAQALSLRQLVDSMDLPADRDAYFEMNCRFHALIMSFARNREIEALYSEYAKKILMFRRRSFEHGPNMAASNAEHRRLLEAILAGDADLARRRAEEHGRSGRSRFLAAIEYRADLTPLDAAARGPAWPGETTGAVGPEAGYAAGLSVLSTEPAIPLRQAAPRS